MKIITNLLTFLFIIGFSAFFVLISFNFTNAGNTRTLTKESTKITISKATLLEKDDGKELIENIPIPPSEYTQDISLELTDVGYVEFWRLATAFFMPNQSWFISFRDIVLSGSRLIIDPQYAAIVSLYDPFSQYTIDSVYGDFSIAQVTNGSYFVWRERDGNYSLYSIDAVVRLDFLDNGKKMTDMVLFPGMYIRFDPKMNAALSEANLFRILQSLEPNGTEDISSESTGIEFVNPRMNTSNQRDSFLMYRLPTQTKLFRMLHVMFYDRVSQIDLFKEYGLSMAYGDDTSNNPQLINPWKKSHLLLLKLDSILANALKNTTSIETFKAKLAELNSNTRGLALGNSVEVRLEKFLTDARFALFGWSKDNQFAEIYQVVSEVVWKAPIKPHAKLMQRLSDIYSKNLVTQKKNLSFANIDTYTPTALELEKTLQSTDIQQRDYFDIALYAFNVLKKTEDRWLFTEEIVNAHPTYTLIQTILISTDRYVQGITDKERKRVTYEWIALHFYLHIISTLTQSVYNTFTYNEDGKIFLKGSYQPLKNEEKLRINESIIQDMTNIDSFLSIISERMNELYGVDSKNNTYLNIKKNIAMFHAFVNILDYESYTQYKEKPYLADVTSSSVIPLYNSGEIIQFDPTKKNASIDTSISTDSSIVRIQSLFPSIAQSSIKKDADGYRIDAAELTLKSWSSDTDISIALTLVISSDITTFNNPMISYNWRIIYILTDKRSINDINDLLNTIPRYIDRLDVVLAGNPGLQWGVRFLYTTNKIAIGTYIFPLVP